MIPPTHPHGHEDLSALFDGELHGDASRFAHKRLAQDVQWRQACGTWQLVGDVLRGHATAAAPAGFAERVQLALERESAAAVSFPSRPRRGWVGGAALAASVAIAAWFVASPLDRAAPASLPTATVATVTPPRAVALPAPAVAAADTASPEVAPPSRRQGERAAVSDPRRPGATVAVAVPASAFAQPLALAPAASADLRGIDAAALVDPFQLPPARLATRPWPRAVLPNHPASGALTAAYGIRPQDSGVAASGSPGFYPFEPRLPPDADGSDAQWP